MILNCWNCQRTNCKPQTLIYQFLHNEVFKFIVMATKRKYSNISIKQKVEAIQRCEAGEKIIDLARDFGVNDTTVRRWIQNKAQLITFFEENDMSDSNTERYTQKRAKHVNLDNVVHKWFEQQRRHGLPLSGPIVQEKARIFNEKMNGPVEFSASNGWLQNWKCRFGIQQLSVSSEKLSSEINATNQFVQDVEKFMKEENLDISQVYNAGETGLYCKLLPSKTLTSRQETSTLGCKYNKERITLFACTNAAGSHKLPLLVVGESKDLRVFKTIQKNALPIIYKAQKNSWLTKKIFTNWFHEHFVPQVTKHLQQQQVPLRVVLLVDNAGCYPLLKRDGIEVKYLLPASTTAILQPMDQGILQSIKLNYKQSFMSQLIQYMKIKENFPLALEEINFEHIIHMSANSWDNVKLDTIISSWKKLLPNLGNTMSLTEVSENSSINATELCEILKIIKECDNVDENDIEYWFSCDDRCTQQYMDDDELIMSFTEQNNDSENIQNIADMNTKNCDQKSISHREAINFCDNLIRYVEGVGEILPNQILALQQLRELAKRKAVNELYERFHAK